MAENNDNSGGAFLVGVLVGGAVGALAALLLAPQKGDETRAYIAEKSVDYASVVKNKSTEVADAVLQNATQISEKALDTVDQLKSKTTDVASTVADRAGEAVSSVKETTETVLTKGKALVEATAAAVQDAIADGREAAQKVENRLRAEVAESPSEPGA
ncbi:MAG: YtxH domain-containing protein [Capsulimonadaceae bacterium]|nr:YtxH domain-containing protein [Capsulimonadaceae bacterium]